MWIAPGCLMGIGQCSGGGRRVVLLLGLLLFRASGLGVELGFAGAVALALDHDDVGVVDDTVDEGGGAGRVREDGWPVAKREIGG